MIVKLCGYLLSKLIIGNTKGFIRGKALSMEGHTHSQYANVNHIHTQYASISHTHDDLYYTKDDIDVKLDNIVDINDPALSYVYAARSLNTSNISGGVTLTITSCKTSSYHNDGYTYRGMVRVGDYFIAKITTFNLGDYVGYIIPRWAILDGGIGGGMAGWPLVIRTSVSYNNSTYYTIDEDQARDSRFSKNLASICAHVIAKENYTNFNFKCEVITNTAITENISSGCITGIANGSLIKFDLGCF